MLDATTLVYQTDIINYKYGGLDFYVTDMVEIDLAATEYKAFACGYTDDLASTVETNAGGLYCVTLQWDAGTTTFSELTGRELGTALTPTLYDF